MLNIIRQNPLAFIAAFVVHGVLVLVMVLSVSWAPELSAPAKVKAIQAVLVNEAAFEAEIKKPKEVDERKLREEEARRKKLEREAEAAKRKRIEEKKRLKETERKKDEAKRTAQALKKKQQQEAARLEKNKKIEQKRLVEVERKRKAKAEKQRKDALAKKKAEAERKRKAAEVKRRAEEEQQRQQQFAEEQAALEAQHQRFIQAEMGRHITLIHNKIYNEWTPPLGWRKGNSCRLNVRVVPGAAGGQVIDVRVTQSCGSPLFDRSVETAVFNASPLPLPSDPKAAERFRNIDFTFLGE